MVTLRKQMRAFCMMCQRYLTNVNTAVKEQVTPTHAQQIDTCSSISGNNVHLRDGPHSLTFFLSFFSPPTGIHHPV